jgi:acyl-CoA thioesterase-1
MLRFLSLLFVVLSALPSLPAGGAPSPTVLVLGDSLSAGYGVALESAWVSRLEERLQARGYPHAVANAGISGDTTRGGLSRLPAALERHQPAVVIIALGGNDGLRGLSLQAMRDNLAGMVRLSREAGARPVLAGVRLPSNYGPAYRERFREVFADLSAALEVPLVPRIMDGVAEHPELMLDDGIHPNAEGHARILDNVWPVVEPLLESSQAAAAAGT